jgi:hypothetical protein
VSFEKPKGENGLFSTPFLGLHEVIKQDVYSNHRSFGMYRWHIPNPIRFEKDLRITIQALGWDKDLRFLPLQDDIASVAFRYQREPHAPHETVFTLDALEVN